MQSGELFFYVFAICGFQGRFMSLFYQERGLSDSQVGIVLSVGCLISIIAAPFWTGLADSLPRHDSKEVILMLTIAVAEITFMAGALIDVGTIPVEYNFLYLFSLRIIGSFCFATWWPLVNAISLEDLHVQHGKEGSKLFGRQRLWGAVSWLIVHIFQGPLIDLYGTKTMFYGHFATSIITIIKVRQYASIKHHHKEEKQQSSKASIFSREVFAMLTKTYEHFGFFLLMFSSAAGMSLVENLLFLFFVNDLKMTAFGCGVSVAITVLFEIPLFLWSEHAIKYFGVPVLLSIASLSYIVRVVVYTLVPTGWWVLLVEPLHGITIAAITVAANEFVHSHAPKGLEASAQGLLAASRNGLGFFFGTSVGGYVMDWFGSVVLYRTFALLVTFALIVYLHSVFITQKREEEAASRQRLISEKVINRMFGSVNSVEYECEETEPIVITQKQYHTI